MPKPKSCLNCGTSLSEEDNFCPRCGQKKVHNQTAWVTLAKEYFQEVFSYDSRLIKSVRPFFLKPGYLTNQFNAGKRVSYINPVRMYLVMSLFYFFALGLVLTRFIDWSDAAQVDIPESANLNELDIDSLMQEAELPDSLLDQLPLGNRKGSIQDITNIDQLVDLLKNPEISDRELLDSLEVNASPGNQKLLGQLRKVARKELDVFIPFLLQNVPIMMLLLLPIFALILKLLYIRRDIFFIQHLVHGLYLHSFAYLIYGIAALLIAYLGFSETGNNWVITISFLVVSVYTFVSFLKVYRQGWFKTLVKFALAGYLYSIFLLMFSIGEFVISFWFF